MAGGTWTVQNKVRPGVYINFQSEGGAVGSVSDRGIVTFPMLADWGTAREVIAVDAETKFEQVLGYPLSHPRMLLVREALKRAQQVLLYRVNEGTKAKVTAETFTATAKHGGVRGNDIKIVIQPNIDNANQFDIQTIVDGRVKDTQTVTDGTELTANDWVTFEATTLTATAGLSLAGGDNGTATNGDYSDYLTMIERHEFHTLALPSEDESLKGLVSAFVKRLRDQEGKKVQIVVANAAVADHEGIINVKNGVVLADGTRIEAAQATVWVAAATAGAGVNESLTYQAYDDAVDVTVRYTNSEVEAALKKGEFVFVHNKGRALVEQDINSLVTFTPEKTKAFSKNRVVRVLDSIANDLKQIFDSSYIGKVNNNQDGRNLFKSEIIQYLNQLQGIAAIQEFDPQQDVTVLAGNDSDAVYCELNVKPVDAVEKIYMKVSIR
ncbi:phage tail sheath family protein [Paenibacillus sp. 1001270B_150601_E10]|uniref:phage tail sheath family protein n=1 Tax=Paenibacillus sp. 1001270B_150601_E10 TaxID=2787079 RepID=UPI00189E9880|nr:phage tail sheath family protein [Paenibacillus sp. 1001270B_150601_E10]